jgi:minor extracellular protease Epr
MTMARLLLILLLALAVAAPPPGHWSLVTPALADDDDDDDDDDDGDGGGGGGFGGGAFGGGSDGGDRRAFEPADGEPPAFLRALEGLIGGLIGSRSDIVPREIIGLGLGAADRAALAAAGFSVIATHPLGALGATIERFAIPAGLSDAAALQVARTAAPGATFDFNHLYSPGQSAVATSACVGDCWPLTMVGLDPAPANACARGAPIAIIDTTVDPTHPALRGAAVTRRSFLPDGATAAGAEHGTAVAALLVGRAGAGPLAPGARLLAAEAFSIRDGVPRADAASILRGLDWAVGQRARVINFSLAGADNQALALGVAAASGRANLVAAAGNGGPSASPAYPAAYPQVAAVAAIDFRRRAWGGGNRGAYVEFSAPGVNVPTAAPDGGVAAMTGTSFAAPFVAAAMLRARAQTGGDPFAARRLLAERAEDLGPRGRDPQHGHGLARAPGNRCQ